MNARACVRKSNFKTRVLRFKWRVQLGEVCEHPISPGIPFTQALGPSTSHSTTKFLSRVLQLCHRPSRWTPNTDASVGSYGNVVLRYVALNFANSRQNVRRSLKPISTIVNKIPPSTFLPECTLQFLGLA